MSSDRTPNPIAVGICRRCNQSGELVNHGALCRPCADGEGWVRRTFTVWIDERAFGSSPDDDEIAYSLRMGGIEAQAVDALTEAEVLLRRQGEQLDALRAERKALLKAARAVAFCGGCGELPHDPNDECWYYDRSDCEYALRRGTCSFDCHEEPSCMTDGPWPMEELRQLLAAAVPQDPEEPSMTSDRTPAEVIAADRAARRMRSQPDALDFAAARNTLAARLLGGGE